MPKLIVWVDDDAGAVREYREDLERVGYVVRHVPRLIEAEQVVAALPHVDLVIVDMMMPTMTDEEDRFYPAAETKAGYEAGLQFARRMVGLLASRGTKLLILTVVPPRGLRDRLRDLGLGDESYAWKVALADVEQLQKRIVAMIGEAKADEPPA